MQPCAIRTLKYFGVLFPTFHKLIFYIICGKVFNFFNFFATLQQPNILTGVWNVESYCDFPVDKGQTGELCLLMGFLKETGCPGFHLEAPQQRGAE